MRPDTHHLPRTAEKPTHEHGCAGPEGLRVERPVPRSALLALERFLRRESGSASLLIVAAVVALVWANLGDASYERVWSASVRLQVAGVGLEEDLRHIVDELLMAVFFYVVALEVKRELLLGGLRDVRTAAVPVAAAFGTMAGAGAAYAAVNVGGDLRGWAVPIATDIAFALGVLGLLGERAPRELRVFMLTLAVVDDLATIAVIAVAFTDGLSLAWLATAVGLVLAVVAAQRAGVRAQPVYVLLAGALWLAVFESGIHATLAGVVLGFLTPAVARHSPWVAARAANAVSPLRRMERTLHPWTAYAILPVFALANAGVPLSFAGVADALTTRIGLGIVLGLVAGAPAGGLLFAWAVVRAGAGRMPLGLDWAALAGVAPLKGIGFTIAIFISGLAFDERVLQEQATLAVLVASTAAALIGLSVLGVRHALVDRGRGSPGR